MWTLNNGILFMKLDTKKGKVMDKIWTVSFQNDHKNEKFMEKKIGHQYHPLIPSISTRDYIGGVRNSPLCCGEKPAFSQVFIINSLIYNSRNISGMPFSVWDSLFKARKCCPNQSPKNNLTQEDEKCTGEYSQRETTCAQIWRLSAPHDENPNQTPISEVIGCIRSPWAVRMVRAEQWWVREPQLLSRGKGSSCNQPRIILRTMPWTPGTPCQPHDHSFIPHRCQAH